MPIEKVVLDNGSHLNATQFIQLYIDENIKVEHSFVKIVLDNILKNYQGSSVLTLEELTQYFDRHVKSCLYQAPMYI